MPLSDIKNIVILMMENRSFDHLLGYLSLGAGGRADVNGLRDSGDARYVRGQLHDERPLRDGANAAYELRKQDGVV